MTLTEKLAELGYDYFPSKLEVFDFHQAVKTGNLVFTSGQVSGLDDLAYKGKVGADIDLESAYKAAELCAYRCLQAAGAVTDINEIGRVVKMLGMVNVAENFENTSGVINGATHFLNTLFEGQSHARSAVGMVLPANWAVEIEIVFELRAA